MSPYDPDALIIDGAEVQPRSTQYIDIISPSTEKVIGRAPAAGPEDVDLAVGAARAAYERGDWRRMPVSDRVAILERAVDSLESRTAEIAHLVTSQMGLPITLSQQAIPNAFTAARFFMAIAPDVLSPDLRPGATSAVVLKEPVGVVAAIAPWNGPFNMAMFKLIPALLAGCSVVFEPAPETPLDAYLLVSALLEAGVPAGAVNLVTGGRETGDALVRHPMIDKVSFTGSTAAGRVIGEVCGRDFKRVTLELGGKSAAIVLEDADLAASLPGLAAGGFFNTGQACIAYSRVLAPRARYDEVVGAIAAAAESFALGDPFDAGTTMGPLVVERQRQRVEGYLAKGRSEGALVATGGGRPDEPEHGWYVQPTVFTGVDNSMTIAREEIFGPVVSVIPYTGEEKAIRIANDSDYGLRGAVFTSDDESALRVASAVRTGTFTVNGYTHNFEAPFGGVKSSGIGRDTGREALESFTELKTVNLTPSLVQRFS